MKRHPCLGLRLPESTSMARAAGFCREKVEISLNKLAELFYNHNITADLLYNKDETGISTVQKPMKVLALKGKHQVGGITSGERDVNTTGVCCINAAGSFVPPMLIFTILLILDGHSTHTKNLEALVLARDYGIVMLSLPSHTTYRLQSLDRSFFKALNSKCNISCDWQVVLIKKHSLVQLYQKDRTG